MKNSSRVFSVLLLVFFSSSTLAAAFEIPLNVSAFRGLSTDVVLEGGIRVPISLEMTYDLKGRLVSNGVSLVGFTDVGIKGKVKNINGVEAYKIVLKGAGVSVKIAGEIGSPTASVKYKGSEGKTVAPAQAVNLNVAAVSANVEFNPEVDARGKIFGDGIINGYNESFPIPLKGKFQRGKVSWSLKFGAQKLTFKGTRVDGDPAFVGIAKVKLPPSKLTIIDFPSPVADFALPRAIALRFEGFSATDVAMALQNEFTVGSDVITQVLIDANFDAVDVARALTSVFSATALEIALILKDVEPIETVLSTLAELGQGVPEVIDVLDQVYSIVSILQIEELLISAQFPLEDILAITQIEVIQNLAPVVYFAGDPDAGFPMSAQTFFDDMLCGQAGGPDSVTTIIEGRADTFVGLTDGLSEIAFETAIPEDAVLEAGDKVEIKNFSDGIDGVYEIVSIDPASGILSVKDPDGKIGDLMGDGDEKLLWDAQDESVAGMVREACAQRDVSTGDFLVPYGNSDVSTLDNGEVPTYFSVTTVAADGQPIEAGFGQLRIRYWWYYGHQPPCLKGGTIAEVNAALDQIDNVIAGINSVSDAIDFLDIIPDIPSTGLGHQVDATNKGEHIADWEHIDIYTDVTRTEVLAVTYFQHTGAYTKRRRDNQIAFEGPRPVVFIGELAHGSYHDPGSGVDEGIPLAGACVYFGDTRGPGIRWETAPNLVSLAGEEESWMLADQTANWDWGYARFNDRFSGSVGTHPAQRKKFPNANEKACSGYGPSPFADAGCFRSFCESGTVPFEPFDSSINVCGIGSVPASVVGDILGVITGAIDGLLGLVDLDPGLSDAFSDFYDVYNQYPFCGVQKSDSQCIIPSPFGCVCRASWSWIEPNANKDFVMPKTDEGLR